MTPDDWGLTVAPFDETVVVRMTPAAALDLARVLGTAGQIDGYEHWQQVATDIRVAKAKLEQVNVPAPPFTWQRCPAGCGRRIRSGHIMCPECWTRVPDELRHETWAALHGWRGARDEDRAAAEVAFTSAREKAIEAAQGELLPEIQETPC